MFLLNYVPSKNHKFLLSVVSSLLEQERYDDVSIFQFVTLTSCMNVIGGHMYLCIVSYCIIIKYFIFTFYERNENREMTVND